MESFTCPEKDCGRKFTRRFNLNRHYQNFHLNSEFVEKCFLCGQMFLNCDQLQKHYRYAHRPSRKFFLKESAFKKAFVTYRYNFMQKEINFSKAQNSIKHLIKERILVETALKTVCKVSLVFIAEMSMYDIAGEVLTTTTIPFRASSFLANVSVARNINKNIAKSFSEQASHLENFINCGSNWQFDRPLAFDIEIGAIRPIMAGQNDVLGEKINIKNVVNNKFLYNPNNKDQKCFLYCIAYHLNEKKLGDIKTQKKEDLFLRKSIKKFDTTNISFPITVQDIKKFLKLNKELNLKINILYRNTSNKVFPIEYGIGEGKNIVNLLMVQTKRSNHFLLIKDANKFLRSTYQKNNGGQNTKSYKKCNFCLHCLNSFTTKETLLKHETYCAVNKPRVEEMPEKNIIMFENGDRQHRLEYVAYCDFECVLPQCDRYCQICTSLKCKCDCSFTDTINNQEPIAYSFVVLGPDKKIIHEHSYAGANAGEAFVEHLLQQEENWLKQLFSINVAMDMTRKNILDHENATNCYICDKVFSSEVIKCRDHSHMTGGYIGAACQMCNLRRRQPKKLKILIHNGSRGV